jgi:hypothetical protein
VVADNEVDFVSAVDKLFHKVLSCPVEDVKVDVLTPVKEVSQMNNSGYVLLS